MYQIKCDGLVLYDPRDDELIVSNPRCKLGTNTVGEASFSIYAKHKHYGSLQKMKSGFEILQDGMPIFRGRMTEDTKDFNNIKLVDLEGVMAYFNDSIVRPFNFPEDFLENAEYVASQNKVEFFLYWLIENHNAQVQPFQRFKLGKVTVADPNNYISRSSEDYLKTWEVLKTKLFDSSLGGYLCIRYEEDGNYIDYLEDFLLTNKQKISFGENLLDLSNNSDASETYSAVIPLGMRKNEIDTNSSDNSRLTIEGLPDGDVTEDIVKSGDMLYSKSAVEKYGFICAPPSETTWEDVSTAENLQTNGVEYLSKKAIMLANTIIVKAVDLHLSNEEIEAFRIYSYIEAESKPHGLNDAYRLSELDIDIHNPQDTIITLGDTTLTLMDVNASNKKESADKIETAQKNTNAFSEEIKKQVDASLQELTNEMSELDTDLHELTVFALELDTDLQALESDFADFKAGFPGEINESITEYLNNDWNELDIDEAFVVFGGLDDNKPMYKVTGNVVEVKGCFAPVEEYASGTEKVAFASGLPEDVRPSTVRSFVCQGAEMNKWLLTIETDGSLTISRYGVSEMLSVPVTEGLAFNAVYTINGTAVSVADAIEE